MQEKIRNDNEYYNDVKRNKRTAAAGPKNKKKEPVTDIGRSLRREAFRVLNILRHFFYDIGRRITKRNSSKIEKCDRVVRDTKSIKERHHPVVLAYESAA